MGILIAGSSKNTKACLAKIGTLNFILLNIFVVVTIITLTCQFSLFQFLISFVKLFCLDSFSMNMLLKIANFFNPLFQCIFIVMMITGWIPQVVIGEF